MINWITEQPNNIKYKCIVNLLYSARLRRGELPNLRINGIDSKCMFIYINAGKGNKNRYTLLSETMLGQLRQYCKEWNPNKFLFESLNGGQYSGASVTKIIKRAV